MTGLAFVRRIAKVLFIVQMGLSHAVEVAIVKNVAWGLTQTVTVCYHLMGAPVMNMGKLNK